VTWLIQGEVPALLADSFRCKRRATVVKTTLSSRSARELEGREGARLGNQISKSSP
jgi:hypothetical protein